MYFILYDCDLKQMSGLTDQEVIFTLIACAAHDIDHPGNTNIFEIKNRSKLAMLYND